MTLSIHRSNGLRVEDPPSFNVAQLEYPARTAEAVTSAAIVLRGAR